MYKLKVLAGPSKGALYELQEGENSIGRRDENKIVLPSSRISKKHCVLVVDNDAVVVRDAGSSNGTFVNGVLAQDKTIKPGDRIGVGDYILELKSSKGNVVPIRNDIEPIKLQNNFDVPLEQNTIEKPFEEQSYSFRSQPVPTNIQEKVLWYFERYVMPFFYNLNLKYEWKYLTLSLFGVFIIIVLSLSIYPLMMLNQKTIIQESEKRASVMAKQIVENNLKELAAGNETKVDIGSVEYEPGVILAAITDLEGRIIAPNRRLNSNLAAVSVLEAEVVSKVAKNYYKSGKSQLNWAKDERVIGLYPVELLDRDQGKNVVVGFGVISIDLSVAAKNMGFVSLMFSQSFIFALIIGAFMFLIIYRLTLKRFEILNDEIDMSLKGEVDQLTNEFKMEELKVLWDLVNSSLQRIPKNIENSSMISAMPFGGGVGLDELVRFAQNIGDKVESGVLILNREKQVMYINPFLEDVSGMRLGDVQGLSVLSAAGDQAFIELIKESLSQIEQGALSNYQDEFEAANSERFKVNVSSFGSMERAIGYYCMFEKKKDEF